MNPIFSTVAAPTANTYAGGSEGSVSNSASGTSSQAQPFESYLNGQQDKEAGSDASSPSPKPAAASASTPAAATASSGAQTAVAPGAAKGNAEAKHVSEFPEFAGLFDSEDSELNATGAPTSSSAALSAQLLAGNQLQGQQTNGVTGNGLATTLGGGLKSSTNASSSFLAVTAWAAQTVAAQPAATEASLPVAPKSTSQTQPASTAPANTTSNDQATLAALLAQVPVTPVPQTPETLETPDVPGTPDLSTSPSEGNSSAATDTVTVSSVAAYLLSIGIQPQQPLPAVSAQTANSANSASSASANSPGSNSTPILSAADQQASTALSTLLRGGAPDSADKASVAPKGSQTPSAKIAESVFKAPAQTPPNTTGVSQSQNPAASQSLDGMSIATQHASMLDPRSEQSEQPNSAESPAEVSSSTQAVAMSSPTAGGQGKQDASQFGDQNPSGSRDENTPASTPQFSVAVSQPNVAETALGHGSTGTSSDFSSALNKADQTATVFNRMTEAVETMRSDGRSNIEVQVQLHDGQQVTVQLHMSNGEIQPVFKTDSADLRSALQEGWGQFSTGASDRGIQLGSANFQSSSQHNGGDLSQRQGQDQSQTQDQYQGQNQGQQSQQEAWSREALGVTQANPRAAARSGAAPQTAFRTTEGLSLFA